MEVYAAHPAGPGQWRNPIGGSDPRDPLKCHQDREHVVGAFTNILLMFVEDLRDPTCSRIVALSVCVSHLLALDIQSLDRTRDNQRRNFPFARRCPSLRTTQSRFDLHYRHNGRAKL